MSLQKARNVRLPQAPASVRWAVAYLLARCASSITSNAEIEMADEGLPPGPRVFVCNHRSFYDPVLGILAFRRARVRPSVVVAEKFFRTPFGPFLRLIDAIPARQGSGTTIDDCVRALGEGRDVALMVEGRIVSSAQEAAGGPIHSGAAVIAQLTCAPVVVMAMAGAARVWPLGQPRATLTLRNKPRCRIVFGDALDPQTKTDTADLTETIRLRLLDLEQLAEARNA